MPPRRSRPKKQDPDVVKTERDHRRATGREEDDEFDVDEQEPKVNLERVWTTISFSRYKRTKLRQPSGSFDEPFPFMRLPAEVRNMVYRHLVVSKAKHKICLGVINNYYSGGIEIAILLANHQVHDEAAKIIYDENRYMAGYSAHGYGIAFRKDEERTKNITSKSLRSGRAVDMIKFTGLIYPEVFERLRHVEFHIDTFDRTLYCEHLSARLAMKTQGQLWSLFSALYTRIHTPKQKIAHGGDWKVVVHTGGPMGAQLMLRVLEPLLIDPFCQAVILGKISFHLEGKFPENWKNIFCHFRGKNFITKKVEAIDTKSADLDADLLDMIFDDDDDGMWF